MRNGRRQSLRLHAMRARHADASTVAWMVRDAALPYLERNVRPAGTRVMNSDLPQHFRINRDEIAHDVIDGEVILINTMSGCYYSLRGTAVPLWGEIEDGRSLDGLRDWAAGQYGLAPAAAAAMVEGFVAGLVADGVLLPADSAAAPGAFPRIAPAAADGAFAAPVVERFTDMQDLLTLDPIHEVDDLGWPHAAQRLG